MLSRKNVNELERSVGFALVHNRAQLSIYPNKSASLHPGITTREWENVIKESLF